MIKVKAVLEFEFEEDGYDEEFVDIKGLAEDSFRRKLDIMIKQGALDADDFCIECASDSDEAAEAAAYREFEEDVAKSIDEGLIKFVPEGVVDFFEKMPADFIARFLGITIETFFQLSPSDIRDKIAETYIQMPYDVFKTFVPELREKMRVGIK